MDEEFATGSLQETVEELTQMQQDMQLPQHMHTSSGYHGLPDVTTAVNYSESREITTTSGYNEQREISTPADYNEQREIHPASKYQEQTFTGNFDDNNYPAEQTESRTGSQNENLEDSQNAQNMMPLSVYDEQFPTHSQNNEDLSKSNCAGRNNKTSNFRMLTEHIDPSRMPQSSNTNQSTEDSNQSNEFLVPLDVTAESSNSLVDTDHTKYEYVIDQACLMDSQSNVTGNESAGEDMAEHDYAAGKDKHDILKLIDNEKKRDPVREVFDTSMETSSELNTSALTEGYTDVQSSETETDLDRNALEKMSQEKTMFSENLGLIRADTDMKSLNQKERSSSKKIRTRKMFEVGYSNIFEEADDTVPISGHKHYPGCYRCGACSKTFVSICKLHNHFQDHNSGGSYHYDDMLKMAFPKYDTACVHTQTGEDSDKSKPFGKGIKFTKLKIKPPKPKPPPPVVETLSASGKRKRGRPRKVDVSQSPSTEGSEKKKKVSKIKVKTEDGGNTWQEVKDEPTEQSDTSYLDDVKSDYAPTDDEKDEVEKVEDTTELVDKYLKEIETDIANIIENEAGPSASIVPVKKKSRNRKMSKPRKLPVTSDSEVEKIINSRSKPELKIRCDFCPSLFQYTRGLMRHEQEKHPEELKLECDVCHQKFMREYNLERHKLCSHTVGRVRLLRKKRGLLKEKRKPGRKPKDQSAEGSRACEVCGKVLPESKAEIHLRIHTGERPYICHVCGKGLISDKKLKRHLLIHSEVQRHTCEVCGEGFSMKYKLRTHMFIHTGHKPYLCSVCGTEFNNSTSLLHHHRTVHLGDKRFECNICGGRYGKKSQLEEHMFSHSNERTQTCRYCGKTFKHAKSLRRHEFTHVSDKKFPCDQCDSKFSRKDNLERHKMCHIEGTLQCSFCKKKFRERQPLAEHEQYHINQKRFQCQLCKEKFQEETYFYNHMEVIHNLTKEMVPLVNALTSSKEDKKMTSDLETQSIVMGALKIANSMAEQLNTSGSITMTTAPDTLNLSMNVAGIIPVAGSGQDMIPNSSHNVMHSILVSQNNSMNQGFNTGQNSLSLSMNAPRSILNQPINPSFASAAHLISGMHDVQRAALNVMSTDGTGMGMPPNQQAAPLSLTTSENMMIHEQQRLMQEALGSSLNMQNPGYRLQNMY